MESKKIRQVGQEVKIKARSATTPSVYVAMPASSATISKSLSTDKMAKVPSAILKVTRCWSAAHIHFRSASSISSCN